MSKNRRQQPSHVGYCHSIFGLKLYSTGFLSLLCRQPHVRRGQAQSQLVRRQKLSPTSPSIGYRINVVSRRARSRVSCHADNGSRCKPREQKCKYSSTTKDLIQNYSNDGELRTRKRRLIALQEEPERWFKWIPKSGPSAHVDEDDLWALAYANLTVEKSVLVKDYDTVLREMSGIFEDMSLQKRARMVLDSQKTRVLQR